MTTTSNQVIGSLTQSRFFNLADGRRLHAETCGSGQSMVVCLHGYLDSWRSFEHMLPTLAPQYRWIALDQRGHGLSDEAPDYSVAGFVADAIEVLDSLALPGIHLIGHSLGAIIALRIAYSRTDIASITLIGGAVSAAGNAALTEFCKLVDTLEDPVPYKIAFDFQKSTAFQPLPATQLESYVEESMKVLARAWKGALHGLIDDPYVVHAFSAPIPTLILWGEHDEVFPLPDQRRLRGHLPQAEVLSFGSYGHAPHWESPTEIGARIQMFLTRISNDR